MYARISALLVAFALAVTGLAAAQETTGTISGRLVDAQGLAVPGATVTATGPQGARTTVTDSEGRYNIAFLTPGVYTVRAELSGFKTSEQRDVTVRLGQTVDVDMRMEVGGLTETVEVSGTAPVIDTKTTTVGAVIRVQAPWLTSAVIRRSWGGRKSCTFTSVASPEPKFLMVRV